MNWWQKFLLTVIVPKALSQALGVTKGAQATEALFSHLNGTPGPLGL